MSGSRVTARAVVVAAIVTFGLAACGAPPDPAKAVTVINPTDERVQIIYDRPDDTTESITEIGPGEQAVIDVLFTDPEAPCRTGSLVALDADGAPIDDLYMVCVGQVWTIEPTN